MNDNTKVFWSKTGRKWAHAYKYSDYWHSWIALCQKGMRQRTLISTLSSNDYPRPTPDAPHCPICERRTTKEEK